MRIGERILRTVLLASLCWLPTCASGPKLRVVVYDSSGAAPVPLKGAAVQLQAAGAPVVKTTSSRGKVAFSGLQPALYQLAVSKPGYSSERQELRYPENLTMDLFVHQVFDVSGRILLPDGTPVPDAQVFFIGLDSHRRLAAEVTESGYRIVGLAPAVYQVQAASADRLHSLLIERFVLEGTTVEDLVLTEAPPQFEMAPDSPSEPTAAGQGRIPKQ